MLPEPELGDQFAAEYAQARERTIEAQRVLDELSARVTTPDGLLTVEMGPQGELRMVVFNSQQYRRMAPAELGSVIRDAVNRARDSLLGQVLQVMPPAAVTGVDPRDLLDGAVDWESVLPEQIDLRDLPRFG